jgi:hypothetical protein
MSFMPCYFLFSEYASASSSSASSDAENPCFPFFDNSSSGWGAMARPLGIFKPRSYASTSCSPALHVESCPSSAPCCISSLGQGEEEATGEGGQAAEEKVEGTKVTAVPSGGGSQTPCSPP